jgi:hypothetical protein
MASNEVNVGIEYFIKCASQATGLSRTELLKSFPSNIKYGGGLSMADIETLNKYYTVKVGHGFLNLMHTSPARLNYEIADGYAHLLYDKHIYELPDYARRELITKLKARARSCLSAYSGIDFLCSSLNEEG